MAAAPKSLPLEHVLALLRTLTAHGAVVLRQALLRPELTALLLGLLCHPHVSQQAELAEFYVLLLPLGRTCEPIWTLLQAVLPSVSPGHRSLLREATGCASSLVVHCVSVPARSPLLVALTQHPPTR